MPLTPELRHGINRIRDYLFGGGYPNPAQNAEQLSFLIYFYMHEIADAARVRGARRQGAEVYSSAYAGTWKLRNPNNAYDRSTENVPRDRLRWSSWANALTGERLTNWVREEVFPFHAELAATGVTDFMDGARLAIDEPTVLTQVIGQLNDLHLDKVDADTKGDLFEHVLRQIRQAGELGQFRTPRHIIRALIRLVNPRLGESVYDPAAGTAGFLVGVWDHIRLTNSSPAGIETIDAEGKNLERGLGDLLSRNAVKQLHEATFYGTDVDPQMVRLATMNLTLRGLEKVHVLRYDVLTRPFDHSTKIKSGIPARGFDVILANPPFSGRVDKDRIVDNIKIGRSGKTELLFLQFILNQLNEGGRCGVVVPEGVLFGSSKAHNELRRKLIENNSVDAVLSLPKGVFNPYSAVKTSLLVIRKGCPTKNVMFLHAEEDGFKLDATHDQPINEDDLPVLIHAFRNRTERWREWCDREKKNDWTESWWFADVDAIRASGYNLGASFHRPQACTAPTHKDPALLLSELRRIERQILTAIDKLEFTSEKSSMRLVRLEEVSTIIAGQSPPSHTYNEDGRGLPFFQGKADFGTLNPNASRWCTTPKKIAEPGDILISVRAPVGPTNIATERCCIGRGLAAIRTIEKLAIRDFVYWTLKFVEDEIANKGQGSTFNAIKIKDLKLIEIPVPSMNDQQRIADSLNQAASILQMRESSEEIRKELIPSMLMRVFGGSKQ